MDHDEELHIRNKLNIHERRLRVLELKDAKQGINTPAEVIMEIEELRESIAHCQSQLEFLARKHNHIGKANPSPITTHSTTDYKHIEITFRGEFNQLTPEIQNAMLRAIAAIVNIPLDEIEVLKIDAGSVIFHIKLPGKAADVLLELYDSGDEVIEQLEIEEIRVEFKRNLPLSMRTRPAIRSEGNLDKSSSDRSERENVVPILSVTLRDVARQAGVSVSTASRYINRNVPISPTVAERLNEVMRDLKYVPHAAARNLAMRRTRVIGLLLSNLHNEFFVPLLNGVEAVVRRKEYNLIVATYNASEDNSMPPPIGPHNTDGLLVFSDGMMDEDLMNYATSGFPMVLVNRTSPASVAIPSVGIENSDSTYKLIDHLIRVHGRRRILFLRGPIHQEDSVQREAAYKAALQAHEIPFDNNLILNGGFERDIAFQSLTEFLSQKEHAEFDAIFTGNDDAAIGVLKVLHESHIRVPEEISVVGFDDLGFAQFLQPPLTTVRVPVEAIGRTATESLFRILENETFGEPINLHTELVIRRSCGCHFP